MDIITLAMAKKAGGGGGIPITKVSDLVNDAGYITEDDLSPYATQAALEAFESQTASSLAAKANASDVNTALAGKASTADVTAQIAAAVGDITSFEYYLCGNGEYDSQTGVPTVEDPDTHHIYLVPTSGTNLNMYAYIDSAFTFLGTTEVDLSGYVTSAIFDLNMALKADKTEIPTVPTKVSAFQNDEGYITLPKTEYYSTENVPNELDLGSGFFGGVDHVYGYYREPTTEEIEALMALGEVTETIYINRSDLEAVAIVNSGQQVFVYCNAVTTTSGAASGYDIDDPTKPAYVVMLENIPNTGWQVNFFGTEHIKDRLMKIFSQGQYLTEHQSLSAYATKAEVTTALSGKSNTGHTHDDRYYTETEINTALAGKSNTGHTHAWSEITGKPYVVTGSAKAYSIVVSESAPADGTADSVITIVV